MSDQSSFPKAVYLWWDKSEEEWMVLEETELQDIVGTNEQLEMGKYTLEEKVMVSSEIKIEKSKS